MTDLPKDWVTTSVGQSASFLTGFPFASARFSESGVRLLRGSNVKRGVLDWSPRITRHWPADESSLHDFKLIDGDLVIAMDGALVGRSYARISRSDLPAYLVQRVARLRGKSIDQELLHQWISSDRFAQHVDSVKTHTAIPHISPRDIRDFQVSVPTSPYEQRRIADGLADADELITSLERVIAKKQAIRQGMMQQLLTGRTRLSGFSSPWKERALGEICSAITDGTHYTPTYVDHGIPFYSVESVTNDDFVNVKHISPEEHRRLVRRCRPRRGDILMTRIGSLAETKYLDWDVDASIYVSLALLRPGNDVDGRYLYAFTKSRRFVKAVEDRALLWAAPRKINMGDIGHIQVLLPANPDEQRAIADVLFAIEDQLKALERLVAKELAIKHAMMQELLTGRTRLPLGSTS